MEGFKDLDIISKSLKFWASFDIEHKLLSWMVTPGLQLSTKNEMNSGSLGPIAAKKHIKSPRALFPMESREQNA